MEVRRKRDSCLHLNTSQAHPTEVPESCTACFGGGSCPGNVTVGKVLSPHRVLHSKFYYDDAHHDGET